VQHTNVIYSKLKLRFDDDLFAEYSSRKRNRELGVPVGLLGGAESYNFLNVSVQSYSSIGVLVNKT